MKIVNQMRLIGEDFSYQKVVEKIMISLLDKFEGKISAIEESCDLKKLTIAELISKLQAQEQRTSIRNEEVAEGAFQAFQAKHKGKASSSTKQNEAKKRDGNGRKNLHLVVLVGRQITLKIDVGKGSMQFLQEAKSH